jgi:hypothetical protein
MLRKLQARWILIATAGRNSLFSSRLVGEQGVILCTNCSRRTREGSEARRMQLPAAAGSHCGSGASGKRRKSGKTYNEYPSEVGSCCLLKGAGINRIIIIQSLCVTDTVERRCDEIVMVVEMLVSGRRV